MTSYRSSAVVAAFVATIVISSARAEIRIGLAVPLTGSYAWAGEEVRAGVDQAVEDLNKRGGVLGETLVRVLVDDFCNADQAVAAANRLVAGFRCRPALTTLTNSSNNSRMPTGRNG